ncbi:uncharacterized protein BKCO1_2900098 [Diplodia corticola]|uniref:Uncharacterized protein n=1 Tax=Diplodia corticola TaxID=236234 RepID=A0A1J9QYZ9_9PEZI|nr:uncharacterized protein BKCO1_2900098 [Diplodia corticola]OJD33624.1 hypothetical protein BKCO1_2900098 [Diplodia corticola]
MLAWIPSAPQPPHPYVPSRSSPLAPRHPNVVHRQPLAPTTNTSHNIFSFSMDPPSKHSAATPPQRSVKPNPLIQKTAGDAGRERRRDMFLKKVANNRDERRWSGRAEQIERLDHIKEQRRWQQYLERSAPGSMEPSDEEEEGEHDEDAENRDPMLGSSQRSTNGVPNVFSNYVRSSPLQTVWSQSSEAEVEVVAQQEDEELDALLAMMEEDERRADINGDDVANQPYNSDDDEYDSIFSEYLAAQQTSQPAHHDSIDDHDYDAMDMTG